jgi:uncharacterized damage-inducible protein DinB
VNLTDHLRKQFAYNDWANREVLAAIENTTTAKPDARSLELAAHILSAETLWLERIRQQPQSLPVWPKLDLAASRSQADNLRALWRKYLEGLSDESLSKPVTYRNSKGEVWTSTVADILTHVLLHSAYHRGQIASHMRETGETPAYTDFIHAVRQGIIE